MITVEGFNAEQKVLADLMWGIDTLDNLKTFLCTLSPEYRNKCITVIEAMRVAAIDDNVKAMSEYSEVNSMLSKFKVKNG